MTPPLNPPEASTAALLKSLIEVVPALISDRVHLLTLELRRAMQALAGILVSVICAAVLLATAWFALWIGLAAVLVNAGLSGGWVALLIVVLNGGAAAFALSRAAKLAPLLALHATMRRLTLPPPPPMVGTGVPSTSASHSASHSTAQP